MSVISWNVSAKWTELDGTLTPEAMRFMSGLIDEIRQIPVGGRFAAEIIALSGSPLVFTAPRRGMIALSGNTVQDVTITRHGLEITLRKDVSAIPVSRGDIVTIKYAGSPDIAFIPR